MRLRHLIFLFLFLPAAASAAKLEFPPLSGRVVDQAGILDASARARLTKQLDAFEQETTHQLVVVTLKDLQGVSIEDYGYQLGRAWGIGQKEHNNGALLIVAPNDRQVRIEVGYGLEGVLTDALSRIIIEQKIIPHFKTGDYAGGIEEGVGAIMAVARGEVYASAKNSTPSSSGGISLAALLPFIILFFFLRSFGRGRRSGMITPLILGSMLGGGSSRSGWGGGGGFSGGGGSFGGGGASGKW